MYTVPADQPPPVDSPASGPYATGPRHQRDRPLERFSSHLPRRRGGRGGTGRPGRNGRATRHNQQHLEGEQPHGHATHPPPPRGKERTRRHRGGGLEPGSRPTKPAAAAGVRDPTVVAGPTQNQQPTTRPPGVRDLPVVPAARSGAPTTQRPRPHPPPNEPATREENRNHQSTAAKLPHAPPEKPETPEPQAPRLQRATNQNAPTTRGEQEDPPPRQTAPRQRRTATRDRRAPDETPEPPPEKQRPQAEQTTEAPTRPNTKAAREHSHQTTNTHQRRSEPAPPEEQATRANRPEPHHQMEQTTK